MKLRIVVDVPLVQDAGEFYPNLKEDIREATRGFPTKAIVVSGEYVPEPEDAKALFKKLLRIKLEGEPPKSFKGDYYEKGDEDAPFYSEAYLYNLIGKEDARSVLYGLDRVMEFFGLDPYGLRREIGAEIAAEQEAEKRRAERVEKRKEFRRDYIKKMGWKVEGIYNLTDAQSAEVNKAMKEAGL